jgi:hypothetical protein
LNQQNQTALQHHAENYPADTWSLLFAATTAARFTAVAASATPVLFNRFLNQDVQFKNV